MRPYNYTRLVPQTEDIRLLTLLPGEFAEPIRCNLQTTPLTIPVRQESVAITVEELRKTLPEGWTAYRTLEGKFIFQKEGSNSEETTWEHPDPAVDIKAYATGPTCPPPEYEPAYEALSYTWGPTKELETAYVVDATSLSEEFANATTLSIGQNLATALRHLRSQNEARTVWVDAVCINQNDMVERSEQVVRMTHIYRLAQRVVVWLGVQSEDSTLAISALQYLGKQIELGIGPVELCAPNCAETKWFHSYTDLPYDKRTWDAIYTLVTRPWFDRLWVCQEVQLANPQAVMLCGSDQILWYHFRRAVVLLYEKTYTPFPNFRERFKKLRDLVYPMSGLPISALLRNTIGQQCLDPRDRIYALLGMIQPRFAKCIHPHYSLAVSEVYKDCFVAHVEEFDRLELLYHCKLATGKLLVPSWVPDWSVPRNDLNSYGYFFAAGISCAQAKYIPNDILEVNGVTAATLKTVSATAPEDPQAALDTIRTWEPDNLTTSTYVSGGSLLDAYISVLCRTFLKERFPDFSYPSLLQWREIFRDKISADSPARNIEQTSDNIDAHEAILKNRGRTFFTTAEGYIGTAPSAARPGDVVCVLLGCVAPMILRPTPFGQFQVVGEGYVESLTDTTGLLGPLPEGWRVQVHLHHSGCYVQSYLNQTLGLSTVDDPRLGPLPFMWERLEVRIVPESPILLAPFRNRETGETITSDPRLLPEALRARGTKLRRYQLI